jgi:hypothetical protein
MGEPADLHAMRRASGPGRRVTVVVEPILLTVTVASGELNGEALAHKVGSIFGRLVSQGTKGCLGHGDRGHPWEKGLNVRKAGTTSRASIASLYSMKPNPFMSLISVISPVPWLAKWASTSALVAVDRSQGAPPSTVEAGKGGVWIHPSSGLGGEEGELTIPGQVAQVEARRRHLGHGCDKWANRRPAGCQE